MTKSEPTLSETDAAIAVAAALVGKIPESQILVELYDKVRTYFERN